MALRPCLDCKVRYTTRSRCDECEPKAEARRRADPSNTGRNAVQRPQGRLRETVLTRADHRCERCGATKVVLDLVGRTLHVHHKDGNARNNRLSNLEALCDGCHRAEHAASPRGDKPAQKS